jgi:outer membrane protein
MQRTIIAFLLIIITLPTYSQSVIGVYIEEGLKNNLALRQKEIDFEVASKALKEAKGMFLPEVTVSTRYSLADGGRVIEFPTGDLMNPVYSSLNQLMQFSADEQFPMLENQEIPFLREREHDTRISLTQPVFNASLISNRRMKKEQVALAGSEIQLFKTELTYRIKEAYFDYLKSLEVLDLLKETQKLAEENLRVNQKLFENDMTTKDAILRAQAELGQLEMEQNKARKNSEMGRNYFNFLLNRPLDAAIEVKMPGLLSDVGTQDALDNEARANRQELKQLELSKNIYGHLADLNGSRNIPSVFLAADYGFQGEEYDFSGDYDFAIFSVGLKWTLFQGSVNKQKRARALLQRDRTELKKLEVQQQIELELRDALLDLEQKEKNLKVSGRQAAEANESYRMVMKKYRNGMASQVELLDARNSKTRAAMNVIINQYELFSCNARLEKIVGRN